MKDEARMSNRYEMFAAMVNGQTVELIRPSGAKVKGVIMGIELEDGSGNNFNISFRFLDGHRENVFIKSSK